MYYPNTLLNEKLISYKLRKIQKYFQPKIVRKIIIQPVGRKNNVLLKKECSESQFL